MIPATDIAVLADAHPLDALGILMAFDVNLDAMKYFGIICFNDKPGYFPQLEAHQAGIDSHDAPR